MSKYIAIYNCFIRGKKGGSLESCKVLKKKLSYNLDCSVKVKAFKSQNLALIVVFSPIGYSNGCGSPAEIPLIKHCTDDVDRSLNFFFSLENTSGKRRKKKKNN